MNTGFEQWDYEHNNPIEKYVKQDLYTQKEIPNVILTLQSNSGIKHTISFSCLTEYYEEFDSENGWRIILTTIAMNLENYQLLTQENYASYSSQAFNFWKNMITGKEESYIEPEHFCSRLSIEHELNTETVDDRASTWIITLYN